MQTDFQVYFCFLSLTFLLSLAQLWSDGRPTSVPQGLQNPRRLASTFSREQLAYRAPPCSPLAVSVRSLLPSTSHAVVGLAGSFPRWSPRPEKPVEICSQLCNLSEWRRNEKYRLERGRPGCSHAVQPTSSLGPEPPSENRAVRWAACEKLTDLVAWSPPLPQEPWASQQRLQSPKSFHCLRSPRVSENELGLAWRLTSSRSGPWRAPLSFSSHSK